MAKAAGRQKKGTRSVKPQEEVKHPPEWEKDLNPHRLEGQNIGRYSVDGDPRAPTGADIKELTRLTDFTLEELREIPIVPPGTPLKEGAVYLDLAVPALGPFVANGGIKAEERHLYAPKAEVPYEYWNRLVRSLCPTRIKEDELGEPKPAGSTKEQLPEPLIDKTIADSFPASDPPSWTLGRDKKNE